MKSHHAQGAWAILKDFAPTRETEGEKMAANSWPMWAILSAVFAALTAILAKVGVKDVPTDFGVLFRTMVVLVAMTLLLGITGQLRWQIGVSSKSYLFLTLSGLATGASWLCYFKALQFGNASQVAPIDKLSVVLVAVIAVAFLDEKLSGLNWLGVGLVAGGAILVAVK
mgnify:CR=1 FL=1